jgi:hypothetical protein
VKRKERKPKKTLTFLGIAGAIALIDFGMRLPRTATADPEKTQLLLALTPSRGVEPAIVSEQEKLSMENSHDSPKSPQIPKGNKTNSNVFQTSKREGVPSSKETNAKSQRQVERKLPVPLTERQVAQVLKKAGIPSKWVPMLTCTARFESGFQPGARNLNKNGTWDSGLFQINDLWLEPCRTTRRELLQAHVNARCTKKILEEQGMEAWMSFSEQKHICQKYKVGDFAKKGHQTIRQILEAYEPRRPRSKTPVHSSNSGT